MTTQVLKLGVNIDHVATLRQARGTPYPDIVAAAREAEAGGADGITVHLREDRRHIQDADVRRLREAIATRLNFEMAATEEMTRMALEVAPAVCCVVPEKREELTTEGGLDVVGGYERLAPVCATLAHAGIEVSLFIDPEPGQIDAAAGLAPTIELHTGRYAEAADPDAASHELEQLRAAAARARAAGLVVNAGHGLHYDNVARVAALPGFNEFNIGHAIVARAVFTGLRAAVAEMKAAMTGVGR